MFSACACVEYVPRGRLVQPRLTATGFYPLPASTRHWPPSATGLHLLLASLGTGLSYGHLPLLPPFGRLPALQAEPLP